MILKLNKKFNKPLKAKTKVHDIVQTECKTGEVIKFQSEAGKKIMAESLIISTQDFKLRWIDRPSGRFANITIDNRPIYQEIERNNLAINNGFKDTKDMEDCYSEGFEGTIVHWTDLKY